MWNIPAITERCKVFDVIDILNRYFTALRHSANLSQGRVHLDVAGAACAAFGLQDDPRITCHQGAACSVGVQRRIAILSGMIKRESNESLKIGAGIHYGPVITDKTGPSHTLQFDLAADAMHIARRWESQTKTLITPVVMCRDVPERRKTVADAGYARESAETVEPIEISGPLFVHRVRSQHRNQR